MRYDPCFRRRLALVLTFALAALAGCDDGESNPPDDTAMDTAGDTVVDTTAPDTEGDTGDDTAPDTLTDTAEDTGDAVDMADGEDGADGDAADLMEVAECPASCPDNMVCNDPAVGCECGPVFEDCDEDLETNGCETNISVPEQCGGCGDARDIACELFGLVGTCSGSDGTYACVRECAVGYSDLDGDIGLETGSDGCETGLVATAAQDLSAALGGGSIVALEHDGTTLFALTLAGTEYFVHAIGVDAQGNASVVDSALVSDSNGRHSLAASNGFVAVAGVGNFFFSFDGTTLTQIGNASAAGASSVSALSSPLVSASQAEFVAAVTSGIAWYGVFAQESDAPATATCFAGGRVCRLDTSPLPTNALGITTATLGGVPWAVGVGNDSTVEHGFDAAVPELSAEPADGATLPTSALDLDALSGDRLIAVQSDGMHVYSYTMSGTNKPETRTDSQTFTAPSGSATDLAVLDEQRLLIGTDGGLDVVHLELPTEQATLMQPLSSVDAVAVGGGWAFAASGQSLVALELDLAPIE